MDKRKKEDVFKDEILPLLDKLDKGDIVKFSESLFNGLVRTMNEYYRQIGYTDAERPSMVRDEIEYIKMILEDRIDEINKNSIIVKPEFDRLEKTDKNFVWDAKFDFDRLVDEITRSGGSGNTC